MVCFNSKEDACIKGDVIATMPYPQGNLKKKEL